MLEILCSLGPTDLCRLFDPLQLHPDGQLIGSDASLLLWPVPARNFLLRDHVGSFHVGCRHSDPN